MLRKQILALSLIGVVAGVTVANDVVTPNVEAVAASATEPAAEPALVAAGITIKVMFEGEAPEPQEVDVSSEPFCVDAHEGALVRSRVNVGENGGLLDVFVQLTDGVPDERYRAPRGSSVLLDQRDCVYEPHVFGIVKKQDIEILNSDDVLHNIHAVPRDNKEFNVGMPNKGQRITKTFKKEEEAILIKCDVHPWMAAYCFSMEHPYFGTTDASGVATIDASELPDGTYGVKLWHEVLGEATGTVEVKDGAGTFRHTFEVKS